MTTHEFGRIADRAFIAAAEEVLLDQQQEPNFSRISTLTGLNRHAVAAAYEGMDAATAEAGPAKPYQRNRLARVLTGWFESPAYTDAEGKPRLLKFDGPDPSFTSLVREFSGDIYARIILDELLRVKAVRMTRDGRIRALSRRFTAGGADADSLRHMGETVRDLLTTLENNLSAGPDEAHYADSAISTNLPPEAVPLLRQLIARRGAAFLDDLEGWLAQHERGPRERSRNDPTVRAGVGLYLIVDAAPAEAKDRTPPRRRRRTKPRS